MASPTKPDNIFVNFLCLTLTATNDTDLVLPSSPLSPGSISLHRRMYYMYYIIIPSRVDQSRSSRDEALLLAPMHFMLLVYFGFQRVAMYISAKGLILSCVSMLPSWLQPTVEDERRGHVFQKDLSRSSSGLGTA